jgi:hypothetical protein
MKKQTRRGPRNLSDMLCSDEKNQIIISIAQNLHYSDIISLSLVSRASYHGVFNGSSSTLRSARHALIKAVACETGSKAECWCCKAEICNVC